MRIRVKKSITGYRKAKRKAKRVVLKMTRGVKKAVKVLMEPQYQSLRRSSAPQYHSVRGRPVRGRQIRRIKEIGITGEKGIKGGMGEIGLIKKFAAAALAFGLILQIGGLAMMNTFSYFNDTENSTSNSFIATSLDFRLANNEPLVSIIGPEAGGEITRVLVAMPEDGSMSMDYAGGFVPAGAVVDPLCQKLTMEAKRNGLPFYSGPLADFTAATSTEFGSWELRFDLPPTASAAHGDKCQGEVKFWAWPQGQIYTGSGFFDEESLPIDFTARMVVLNEIFANPASGASPPKDREYVELYNNGNASVDVLGWKISEMAGATETPHTIVATGATGSQMQPFGIASTTIASHGMLVLQFGGSASHFNNSGDTVKFYDASNTLLDGHTYPNTAAGKAHVRFPDGLGYWVDPEPTPGEPNVVTLEDLRAAGFDETTIAEIIALLQLVGGNDQLAEQLPEVSNEPELCSQGDAGDDSICLAGPEDQPADVGQILPSESSASGATTTQVSPGLTGQAPEVLGTSTIESIVEPSASTTPNLISSEEENNKTDKSNKTDETNITEQELALLPNPDQTPAIVPEAIENDNEATGNSQQAIVNNEEAIEAPPSEVIISPSPEVLEPAPPVDPPAPAVEAALPPPPPAEVISTGGSNE